MGTIKNSSPMMDQAARFSLVVFVPVDGRLHDEDFIFRHARREREVGLADGAAAELAVHVARRLKGFAKHDHACSHPRRITSSLQGT